MFHGRKGRADYQPSKPVNADEKYPKLALPIIAVGMLKCRENAKELRFDSELLAKAGRYSSAYMLAHTVCEELAKFFVLDLAGKRIAQNIPPVWKRFWQRIRSHDSKIAHLSIQLLKLQVEDNCLTPDLVAAAEELFKLDLLPRNASLYVDIGPDGQFRKPSDFNFDVPLPTLLGIATHGLHAADRFGATVAELQAHLQQPATELERDSALRVMEIVVGRMRDAGLSKDEVLEMMQKHEKGR